MDGQTIEAFETDLKSNLYRIWSRMSSGRDFPPPVRAVSIPKKNGGERVLGVPTVSDRIAQMVVKQLRASQFLHKLARERADLFVHWRVTKVGAFA